MNKSFQEWKEEINDTPDYSSWVYQILDDWEKERNELLEACKAVVKSHDEWLSHLSITLRNVYEEPEHVLNCRAAIQKATKEQLNHTQNI